MDKTRLTELKNATNYNFIHNWSKIKTFLNDEEFEILCNEFFYQGFHDDSYIDEEPLFNKGRFNDEREDILDDIINEKYSIDIIEETIRESPEEIHMQDTEDTEEDDYDWFFDYMDNNDECADKYFEIINKYKMKYYQENKNDIWWFWKPVGQCHNMGEILLYLAKKVEPTENWKIHCSIAHTTVWNGDKECPKFFDLNFFFEDNNEYILNKTEEWVPCDVAFSDFLADIFGVNDSYKKNITDDYITRYNNDKKHKKDHITKVTNDNIDEVIEKLKKAYFNY